MNTHNDFLNNAVDDGLETEGIGDLTTDVCSDMQNDTCGDYSRTTSARYQCIVCDTLKSLIVGNTNEEYIINKLPKGKNK